jgi:hypothetical protein
MPAQKRQAWILQKLTFPNKSERTHVAKMARLLDQRVVTLKEATT